MAFWERHENPRRFFRGHEEEEIVRAITEAEKATSGEIRVHLERRCHGDPLERARRLFSRLGMARTRHRNGVLIYIALRDRRFAILGDEGIHQIVGDDGWNGIRDGMGAQFARGQFSQGVCEAIARVGEVLKRSFPVEPGDINELSNRPSFGD